MIIIAFTIITVFFQDSTQLGALF